MDPIKPSHLRPLIHRGTLAAGLLLLILAISTHAAVREIVVTNDFTLEAGATLSARLVVRANHVTIQGNGASLVGTGVLDDLPSLEKAGVGIQIEGCVNVRILNLRVRGFANGLLARNTRALHLEECDFSDNYSNPKHGWGELPPRGGILFEKVRDSVIRQTKANRVWDGIHLVDSDDNLIEDCDFSHCSNTCAKLWHASRNRFLRNNLSYGIRIDRAAGEVHARDSTSVLIETGSDDNYWFRNDVTNGGDGIFIRVLNGWVSRGNVFVENDTSYANNNCIESWSPGNTYIRNKANHGSYGFWLGGSDQTVLIGNEAGFNGLTNGYHQAPEPGFRHGGIVIVGGPSSHTLISGNWCHNNNGGGIVFRGDAGSKGKRWSTEHWIVQQNRLESNRWGIWGQWGKEVWLGNNTFRGNSEAVLFTDCTEIHSRTNEAVRLAPIAEMVGSARGTAGQPIILDARGSRDPQGRELRYLWRAGEVKEEGAVFHHTFAEPGFYRVGLTVDNGVLADLQWRDLVVAAAVDQEIGTEGEASQWGFELEGNSEGRGRVQFQEDSDAVVGRNSVRWSPNPYPGQYATVFFPTTGQVHWDWSKKKQIRFWIKATNPNLPGFQNAGPVFWINTSSGKVKLEPAEGRNLFGDLPFSEARWTWMPVRIPLAGDKDWKRSQEGTPDLQSVSRLGIALDSWGGSPFTIWIDGLSAE